MTKLKYFDAIRAAQKNQRPLSEMPPFDLGRIRKTGLIARIVGSLAEDPRWALSLLRRFRPTGKLFGVLVVTKNADVRDILERGDEFQTPYGPEMTELARGSNFILGMQDGADYRRMKSSVLSAFPPAEVEAAVRPIAARHSQEIMTRASPGFDAISRLMKIVPVHICRDYFGVEIDDESEFADWAIALSALFFSDPTASPVMRELAVVAGDRLLKVIDRSIQSARDRGLKAEQPLARLVVQMDQGRLSRDDLNSIMLGMIAGFVPTNVLAAGNCLDVILSRPDARQAIDAALAENDTAKLDRAVLEAMRFKPIWVGPWRYTARDAIIGKGTRRERLVKAGTVVMPATLSAMFDADAVQNPDQFDTSRPHRDYMVFGHGIHQCIGAEIARIQIGESLRALFQKQGVRRMPGKAGRMTRIGAYPETLKVDFERAELCRTVTQSMVTVVCPVTRSASLDAVRDKVASLGNPAVEDIRTALDIAGTVHFTSLTVVGTGEIGADSGQEKGALVLEISGDGSIDDVIDAVTHAIGHRLRPIFKDVCDLRDGGALNDFLRKHNVDISPSFGSNAGLVFSGTPGHSVQRIKAEQQLFEAVRDIVERPRKGAGNAPAVLAEVRQHVQSLETFAWAFEPAESLLEKPPGHWGRALMTTLLVPPVFVTVAIIWAACWYMTYSVVFGRSIDISSQEISFTAIAVAITSLLLSGLGVLVAAALLAFSCLLALRRREDRDRPESTSIGISELNAILVKEGHAAQNHLTAISTMKAGILRRLALRFSFYLISIAAQKVFKPGFLNTINTIHFARWILLPGSNRLMFFSNYGGSWESYLEDFIAKASAGLTGVWSNTVGYPRTRWLFLDGARDGDRFKRWARRQQVPTLFWYSAYPQINTERIRINSRVRRGIASAVGNEARDWLSLFGSLRRPASETTTVQKTTSLLANISSAFPAPLEQQLETGEIQSIFFGPLGPLAYSHMLAIRVPDKLPAPKRRAWLDFVVEQTSFGEGRPAGRAMIVAFGPGGLRQFGLDEGVEGDPLETFPIAFRHGMGNPERGRILDDRGRDGPDEWEWGSLENPVDLVIVCYAEDPGRLKTEIATVRRKTTGAGMKVVAELPLAVNRGPTDTKTKSSDGAKRDDRSERGPAYEHFGFADGISQPIVRGTTRASRGAAPMHLVAPGEFLFGYRDEHGFYPASPSVSASRDRTGILSQVRRSRLIPGLPPPPRDFGRNGSFLVIRQFEQHVDVFNNYCKKAAALVASQLGNQAITQDWIAAKMLGRWQNGSSLVRNPDHPGRVIDNNFAAGAEDPQGHRCPLGAHIRRSNPRDSLGEDRDTQINIGKRHRILRVGRTYEKQDGKNGKVEKGLLFMCLNADIERQYEFIQQTWVSSATFQGLVAEKDPTIGSRGGDGRFTIPSWEKVTTLRDMPQFVTTKGGGYFFMPSRSALRYLISRL
ncbi:cytochrome P450 [Mesorhizobium sp. LNJC399B00]|uniref:cytochrome P450 n=1 Tax=unclassified Mesorhizobium TaxID=325217 RepID=UPI0003CEBAF9|nr:MULTISPECIES: cytochrome P450 [unclassified Mesorhizobium]ESY03074.1 cytochrome P450 [Mesorhizobium sp. LNJC399B00]WJI69339.1 cytochrome P450 [Mesorhizobium sp. C399B]